MTLFSTNSLVMKGFFDFSKDGFGFEQIDLPVVFVDFQIIVAAVEKQQPDNKRHEDDEWRAKPLGHPLWAA